MTQTSTLVDSLYTTWSNILAALPNVALAAALMLAGWLVARLARRIVVRVLRAVKLDEAAENAGLDDFLVQGGIRYTTVTLLAGAVYWMILLGVFVALLDALGIEAARNLWARMLNYLPNVVLAVGVLVFGTLTARIAGGVAHAYLRNIGSAAAEPIGVLARYAVLVFVLFMAAEQLTIGSVVLVSAFQIAFASVCLAAALAFGLGGRDWAAGVIDRYTKK